MTAYGHRIKTVKTACFKIKKCSDHTGGSEKKKPSRKLGCIPKFWSVFGVTPENWGKSQKFGVEFFISTKKGAFWGVFFYGSVSWGVFLGLPQNIGIFWESAGVFPEKFQKIRSKSTKIVPVPVLYSNVTTIPTKKENQLLRLQQQQLTARVLPKKQ